MSKVGARHWQGHNPRHTQPELKKNEFIQPSLHGFISLKKLPKALSVNRVIKYP